MGTLVYGPALTLSFDDRALAHLQLVITAKLRRGESFVFSFEEARGDEVGRTTVWMHADIPMIYRYDTTRMPAINREWLESLTAAASSAQGLMLTEEPVDPARLVEAR